MTKPPPKTATLFPRPDYIDGPLGEREFREWDRLSASCRKTAGEDIRGLAEAFCEAHPKEYYEGLLAGLDAVLGPLSHIVSANRPVPAAEFRAVFEAIGYVLIAAYAVYQTRESVFEDLR